MALLDIQIQQLYTAYLGRPVDQEGLDYWKESGLDVNELRANLATDAQPEYQEMYGDRTREQLVTAIYQNMFGRTPDSEGLVYWVNGDGASVPASELQQLFIAAASDSDRAEFNARVEAHSGPQPNPEDGETIRLTQQADDLQGADGVDTTFVAPVTQNETGSGQLANTFETGDVLNGGADSTNVLRADLIATGTIQDAIAGAAISAETANIQEVYLRAQAVQNDTGGSNTTYAATIDAEKMVGVEQWWSDNSRADIRIEDIRTRPVDTTFGLRSTDPSVGFDAYFNPLFMDGDLDSESQLTIEVAEIDGDVVLVENELANITVNNLRFTLDGEDYVLASEAMQAANTWAELEAAIAAELEAAELSDLVISHLGEGRFGVIDQEGREFSADGGLNIDFGNTDVRNTFNTGLEVEEGPTQTTLILDGAGNGSQGGLVNIAAMSGDRGVEVFDVEVDRSSHIEALRSVNNPNGNNNGSYALENMLEVVNLTHVDGGAQGMFQLGDRTVDANGVSTTIDDRLIASLGGEDILNADGDVTGQTAPVGGLMNVREFNAQGFSSAIKMSAVLDERVFDKYLAGAIETGEVVQFDYLLGDGGNNLSLAVENSIAADPDFALNIVGGEGEDRVNLTDLAVKNSTSIDLEGSDNNTVEINTTTGAANTVDGVNYSAQQTAFRSIEGVSQFVNVDRLVIAGDNDTVQNVVVGNMTAIDGQEIVIATGEFDAAGALTNVADTAIVSARIDTELTLSGKNQTLGSGNNNNDQLIGEVNVQNTRGIPTQNNLEVTLDNTARLNGTLAVEQFNIGTTAGGTSAVRVLDLTSDGRRNVDNLVQSAALAGVNTVNLDGTQSLAINIADMASGASVVDGSALDYVRENTADNTLLLAIDGSELTGASDVLTGTAGDNDTLAVYGAGAQATVTGFETLQLGLEDGNVFTGGVSGFSGTFNAAAVSGVEQYSIAGLSGSAELINLSGSEVVNVAATDANQDLTLIAADRANGNEITVNFAGDYSSDLSVQDYRTVNLGLATGDYDFTLDLETEDGTNADTTYARTLNVTGGGFDGEEISTLDIGGLDTALTLVDLSGYVGNLVEAQWASTEGTNATVVGNAYNFRFDVSVGDDTVEPGEGAPSEFITRFDFDTDAAEQGVVWQIDGFQVFGEDFGLSDQSIIDLRDLGITSAADIVISDAADFWSSLEGDDLAAYEDQGYTVDDFDGAVVTSNQGLNFTIVLTGVDETTLVNENFAGIA